MNMESLDLLSSIKDLRGSFSADTKIPGDNESDYLQGLPELRTAISLLTNISLSGMASVKLMNRTDVKYILNANILPTLIRKVAKDYFIQEIDGNCVAEYGTTYLDTIDLRFFRTHMNGKLNRFKWRIRSTGQYAFF